MSISRIFKNKKLVEYYNFQDKNFQIILPNGYIDILKPNVILNSKLLHGKKILPFITSQTNDIDILDDFRKKNKLGFIQEGINKTKKKNSTIPYRKLEKRIRNAKKLSINTN